MRLGDHPALFAAIMDVLGGLPWALGVHVSADPQSKGYRCTVTKGTRFLTHSRQVVIPVTAANSRDILHTVRCQIDEAMADFDKIKNT